MKIITIIRRSVLGVCMLFFVVFMIALFISGGPNRERVICFTNKDIDSTHVVGPTKYYYISIPNY